MNLLNPIQQTKAIELLADAFDTNYSVNYVVKQDAHRKKRIRYLMEYSINKCKKYGSVYLNQEETAVMLLLDGTRLRNTFSDLLSDLKLVNQAIGWRNALSVLTRDSQIKKGYTTHNYYYLWFIGVNINQQGKGIGTELLASLIQKADQENKIIYLETSNPKNLPLYHRFSFKDYQVLEFNTPLHCMHRIPNPVRIEYNL